MLSTFASYSSDETSKDEEADPDVRDKAIWPIGRKSKNCFRLGICNKGANKNVGMGTKMLI